jgi:SAM-dependent methyltransferase
MPFNDFQKFSESVFSAKVQSDLTKLIHVSSELTLKYTRQVAEEARCTLDFLKGYELTDRRILEAGAGAGLVGAYLSQKGHNVVSIEPGQPGFSLYSTLFDYFTQHFNLNRQARLHLTIEEAARVGPFDFVFSNNVLEHVIDLQKNMSQLMAVLAPGGIMVHNCANYLVPFEPHYGLPLIPFVPKLTELFLPPRIKKDETWKSLNFITSFQVQSIVHASGYKVRFKRGTLKWALSRLRDDPSFASRHRFLANTVGRLLSLPGFLESLELIPPKFVTPMIFEVRKT